MSELINWIEQLKVTAKEIRLEGHNGWGNTCDWAADELERLAEIKDLAVRDSLEQADENKRLEARNALLEDVAKDLQKFVDAQAQDEGLWPIAQYASEAYIQDGLRGCHAFIEQSLSKLEES